MNKSYDVRKNETTFFESKNFILRDFILGVITIWRTALQNKPGGPSGYQVEQDPCHGKES